MNKRFFSTALALVLAFVFVANVALAARLGGRSSFGSRSTYSRSYSPPAKTPSAPAAPAQAAPKATPTTAATPGVAPVQSPSMFSRMGYGLGGLVAGGLIGSMLFGGGGGWGAGGGGGVGMMDILLIGLVAFLAYKLYRRMTQPSPGQQSTGGVPPVSPGLNDPHSRAEQSWDHLRSNPAQQNTQEAPAPTGGFGVTPAPSENSADPVVPAGFSIPDFLEGAKTVYARLQHSWDRRDLSDIALFTTAEVLAEIRSQAASDPTPSKTELLLVNAKLLEFKEESADTVATVLFDVLMREDLNEERPKQIREVWHFSRPTGDLKANWRLEGIQQLEG